MAEWFNAPVLKTGEPQGSGGSNPSLSANFRIAKIKLLIQGSGVALDIRYQLFVIRFCLFQQVFCYSRYSHPTGSEHPFLAALDSSIEESKTGKPLFPSPAEEARADSFRRRERTDGFRCGFAAAL